MCRATCGRSSTACSMISHSPRHWASLSIPSPSTAGWSPPARRHRRQAQAQRVRGTRSQPGDQHSQRGHQGACPTLCPSSFRRSACGHARRAHRDDVRRHALHRQDTSSAPRRPSCPFRAAVHGTGSAHRAVGEMPAPDGFRRITHMLVDAGAHDFTWVDPKPSRIIETPRRSVSRFRPRSSPAR